MKVVGIILVVLEVLALISGVMDGSLFGRGIPFLIGYCLPGIIGLWLISKANKKAQKKQDEE